MKKKVGDVGSGMMASTAAAAAEQPSVSEQDATPSLSTHTHPSAPLSSESSLPKGLQQVELELRRLEALEMYHPAKLQEELPLKRPQALEVKLATATTSQKAKKNEFDFFRVLFEGAVAGATAGVVVETVLYPIDTIKTRLQAVRAGAKISFKGLYSGLGGNLAGVLPASAIFVGVYEPVKQKLQELFPEHLSSVAHLTAGAIGGAAASLVRVPTEVVKQRMQTGQFSSAYGAVRSIASKEGLGGLYAGGGAFLLRDLPFDAIQFCLYEQLRIGYKKAAKRDLYDHENALIGAFAGAVTGAVTTPLDVIKTRLMTQGAKGHYKGLTDCVVKIMQEEGGSAFLKGIGPRVMWIGIGGSIFFGVLERTKQLMSSQRLEKLE